MLGVEGDKRLLPGLGNTLLEPMPPWLSTAILCTNLLYLDVK
jgi:hypothetical protein